MTRANRSPAWSIVVPTFNRPERLAACVAALSALHPPAGGFEIIVVNDGGVEPNESVRAGASSNARASLFLTQNPSGPAAARNLGAEHGRGEWLAFTDDDCAPDPDWLLVLEQTVSRSPHALVGGSVRNALRTNLFSEASQRLAEYTAAYFDGTGRERFFTSNNLALSRAQFIAAGGFNSTFGRGAAEDREFCDRWHAQGRASIFEPRAVVHHSHHLSVSSFLCQHHAYGRGARKFREVRQSAGRPVRIDPAFYLGSLRHAWLDQPFVRGAALTVLTAAAHGAYLVGLTSASLRAGRDALPKTVPAAHNRTSGEE